MVGGAHATIALFAISTSAILGLASWPFWMALMLGAALSLLPIIEQRKLEDRANFVGAGSVLQNAHLSSLVNGCCTALSAWAVGAVLRLAIELM